MLTKEKIEDKVIRIIKNNLNLGSDADKLTKFDNLEYWGINSILFVKLVVAFEEEFGIEFDDDDLYFENFKKISDLVDYLYERIQNA